MQRTGRRNYRKRSELNQAIRIPANAIVDFQKHADCAGSEPRGCLVSRQRCDGGVESKRAEAVDRGHVFNSSCFI